MASKEQPSAEQRAYPKVSHAAEQRLLGLSAVNPAIVSETIERLRSEEGDLFRAIGNAIHRGARSREDVVMATKIFAETVLLFELQAAIDAEDTTGESGQSIAQHH